MAKRAAARTTKRPAAKKAATKKVTKQPAERKAGKKLPGKAKVSEGQTRIEGMSDAALQKATGRTWDEWHAALDGVKASTMLHKDIAMLLREKFGVGEWWAQMVTVGYERARGLRVLHQKVGGFSVGASKTIEAPVGAAFGAWVDDAQRAKWLPGAALTIRKATPGKSVRAGWREADGRDTLISVNFYAKGSTRCQVAVQHEKLNDAREAASRKAFWGERVEALKSTLES